MNQAAMSLMHKATCWGAGHKGWPERSRQTQQGLEGLGAREEG